MLTNPPVPFDFCTTGFGTDGALHSTCEQVAAHAGAGELGCWRDDLMLGPGTLLHPHQPGTKTGRDKFILPPTTDDTLRPDPGHRTDLVLGSWDIFA